MPEDDSQVDRRTMLRCLGAGAASAGLAGCLGGGGGATPTPRERTVIRERTVVKESEGTRQITALGGITGGSGYQQCLVFQQAVHQDHDDIRVTVSGTSGWKTDAQLMYQRGEAEFGIVPAGDLFDITHGNDPYADEQNYILTAFPGVPPSYLHVVVRANSDIQGYADLAGKRVNILTRGSLTASLMPTVLDAIGVEPADYFHYPHEEARGQLNQGNVDALAAAGVAAPYIELSQSTPLRVLSLTDSEQTAVKDAIPFIGFSATDFSQWYNGAGESTVPASWIVMAALESLEDDFVYEMVKTTFDNIELGAQIYEPFGTLEPQMAADTGLPVHPGAYRYYEEQGVSFPDELTPPYDLPLG